MLEDFWGRLTSKETQRLGGLQEKGGKIHAARIDGQRRKECWGIKRESKRGGVTNCVQLARGAGYELKLVGRGWHKRKLIRKREEESW